MRLKSRNEQERGWEGAGTWRGGSRNEEKRQRKCSNKERVKEIVTMRGDKERVETKHREEREVKRNRIIR